VRRLKSTYRRNGTLNLFAALNVATGEVRKKTTKTKTRIDFRSFTDEVVKDAPIRKFTSILDNYATHKKNDEWLKIHPNVTFHYTPTCASWLNQIEIWFGILGRKALNGASFNSPEDLAKAIDDFCEVWHENAHPFVWKKREVRGSQIRNTVVNLLEQTLAVLSRSAPRLRLRRRKPPGQTPRTERQGIRDLESNSGRSFLRRRYFPPSAG
jgi:transposase